MLDLDVLFRLWFAAKSRFLVLNFLLVLLLLLWDGDYLLDSLFRLKSWLYACMQSLKYWILDPHRLGR